MQTQAHTAESAGLGLETRPSLGLSSMLGKILQYAPSVLATGAVALVIPAILAHRLGPAGFGIYALGDGVLKLSIAIGASWLVSTMVRFGPTITGTVGPQADFRAATWLACTAAAIAAAGSLLWERTAEGTFSTATAATLVVAAPLLALAQAVASHLRAIESIAQYTAQRLVASLLLLVVVGGYAVWAATPSLAVIFLATGALPGAVAVAMLFRTPMRPASEVRSTIPLRTLLVFGAPLGLTFTFEWVLTFSDRFVLQALSGAEATGLFAAPATYAEQAMVFVLGLLHLALGPHNAHVWERHGPRVAVHEYHRQLDLVTALLLPLAVLIAVFRVEVVEVLAGETFVPAAPVMGWIAVGVLLSGYQWVLQRPLLMMDRTRDILGAFGVAAAIKVGLTFALVGPLGLVGAAGATVLAKSALGGAIWSLGRRHGVSWRLPRTRMLCAVGLGIGCTLAPPFERLAPLGIATITVAVLGLVGACLGAARRGPEGRTAA